MGQFGIYRLRGGQEIVCRIQVDFDLETRYVLCASVVRRRDWLAAIPRLQIPVTIDGDSHLIVMTQMSSLPSNVLGEIIGSAEHRRDEIVRAIDLLVTGF